MFLLVLENNILINQNIILHLIARFLFVFAITIPFDIRDLKFDDKKMKTIPIVFGERKARLIGLMALFFAEIITIVQLLHFSLPYHHLIALICIFFLSAILIIKSTQDKTAIYFSFWVESLSIYFYLFLMLSTLLF
jgi:4-hydroxybenzoate polyprenyltransferase